MKIFESTHAIRFPDCDPFNHLNNSRYIDYFINAREDQVEQNVGLNFYAYGQKTGKSWVVSRNQIAYLSPALLMEKVVIQSTILKWAEVDLVVEMRMWNEAKTKLKALMWSRFVHYDLKNQTKVPHDEALYELFQQNFTPINPATTFEDWVSEVRNMAYGTF